MAARVSENGVGTKRADIECDTDVSTSKRRKRGKVAVTGSAGFLGQLARQECEELGYEVVGIDLSTPNCQGGPRLPGAGVADQSKVDVECDLATGCVEGILEGCDSLIHLAGDGRPSAKFLEEVMPNNIAACYKIFEEAKRAGVKRVIFASTNHTQHGETMQGGSPGRIDWAALDTLGGAASVKTADPLSRAGPDSFYAVSKLCGEALGSLYSRQAPVCSCGFPAQVAVSNAGSPWDAPLRSCDVLGWRVVYRAFQSFEFVALRIGWCLYEKATALRGHECEDFLRCMWMSHRDFRGFLRGSLQADLSPHRGFLVAYAVSRNGRRLFDIEDSVKALGYSPQDDAEDHFAADGSGI